MSDGFGGALSYQFGRATPMDGPIDKSAELEYRKQLQDAIDKLEELRQKHVEGVLNNITEEHKAQLVALTEAMQALAQGQIAKAMTAQARAQKFASIAGKMTEIVGPKLLRTADQPTIAEADLQIGTFRQGVMNWVSGEGPAIKSMIQNAGGIYATDADGNVQLDANGNRVFNGGAINALTEELQKQGSSSAIMAMVTSLGKLDPGMRANTATEIARRLQEQTGDAFAVASGALGAELGLNEVERRQLGAAIARQNTDIMAAKVGSDAFQAAATEQEMSADVWNSFVDEITSTGLSSADGAALKQVLQRGVDDYKAGVVGRGDLMNMVNAPYYDDKIKQKEGQIAALDRNDARAAGLRSDPLLRAADRMANQIPVFDAYQIAMKFPDREKAALWTAKHPNFLRQLHVAAQSNPALLGDVAQVSKLLAANGAPMNGLARLAYGGHEEPLLPTAGGGATATPEAPGMPAASVGAPEPAEAPAPASPAAPAQAPPEVRATAQRAMELMDKKPESVDPEQAYHVTLSRPEGSPPNPEQDAALAEFSRRVSGRPLNDIERATIDGLRAKGYKVDIQSAPTQGEVHATAQKGMAAADKAEAENHAVAQRAQEGFAASAGATFKGAGGYSYKQNPDDSYTIVDAPAGSSAVGVTINPSTQPDMWAAIDSEHQRAGALDSLSGQPAQAQAGAEADSQEDATRLRDAQQAGLEANARAQQMAAQAPKQKTEEEIAAEKEDIASGVRIMPKDQPGQGQPGQEGQPASVWDGIPPAGQPAAQQASPDGGPPLTDMSPQATTTGTTAPPPMTLADYGAEGHRNAALASWMRKPLAPGAQRG